MSAPQTTADKVLHEQLEAIARKHLCIETLATRNSDRLDFHEVGVGSLRDALEAAFRAGQAQDLA